MRTTLNIDDELLEEAQRLTGISERTALVRAGLVALVLMHPYILGELAYGFS